MMKLLDTLARTKIIVMCFITMLILGLGFGFFTAPIGGELLDMQMNGANAKTRLAEMNSAQRHTHLWVTLLWDSLYPLAYGGFLAGIAARFSANRKLLWAMPALLTVGADFFENSVQVLALLGFENLLVLKSIITPIKFASFFVAALIALVFLCAAVVKKFRAKP